MSRNRRKVEQERVDDRLSVISPLLSFADKDDKESKATFRMLRKEAAIKYGISTRTVDRYLAAYQKDKSPGLKAKYPEEKPRKLSDEIINRAIELKKEKPPRSIEMIIDLLVQEGLAKEGEIKRTTLQDAMTKKGYSCSELRLRYRSLNSSDRYEASKRNELWVTDIKYGPKIMYEGKETQTYLSAIMDDYSRHIVYAKFYVTQGAPIVVDSLRHAIEEYGVPEELYFDNGKMYRSKMVERLCKILGIRMHHSPPYRAQARGKIERFFGTMNAFMDENEVDPAATLSELNKRLDAWIELKHEHHVNRTTHQQPEERYRMSRARQNFVSKELIDYAVRREVTRKVDNCGDISFDNHDFHVGKSLAHRVISLIYDDSDHTVLYMENDDGNIVEIRARNVGRYVNNSKPQAAQDVEHTTHYLDNLTAKASGKAPDKVPETLFEYEEYVKNERIAQTIRYDDEEDW